MQPRKVPAGSRPRRPAPQGRTLRYRRPAYHTYPHRRGPGDEEIPERRPPHVEVAVTVAVFLFVMFVVFGGLRPDPGSFSKIEPVSSSVVRPR